MGPRTAARVEVDDQLAARSRCTGRPTLPTLNTVETLRFFVREGLQWRELRATVGSASGTILRRRLYECASMALLRGGHLAAICMVCPEREPTSLGRSGRQLTGPNPTDRVKPGAKYHVVVATDGLPLGAVPSAANVHDTRPFRHLPHLIQVACTAMPKL